MQYVISSKPSFISFSKLIVIIVIFSLFLSSLTISAFESEEKEEFIINNISGIAYIKYGGGSVKVLAYEGMSLGLGDSIITDDYSIVELISPEGDLMTLYANSIFTITELSDGELHLTSWVGSSYIEAKSRKNTDKNFILNTPSSQFFIKGTHLFTNVNSFTGDSQINVFSGYVQSISINNDIREEANDNEESNYNDQTTNIDETDIIELYPTFNGHYIIGQNFTTTFDPGSFIQEANPDVILKLLLNKQTIDTENEELNSELVEHLIQLGLISGSEEKDAMEEAIQNYINYIIQNSLEQNKIQEVDIPEELLNSVLQSFNNVDSIQSTIIIRQQEQIDLFKQQQEERERQLEEQKRRQEELQREHQELLDQIQKQYEEQQKLIVAAEEERRRLAEELFKQRLDEEERRRFEEAQKQREEERKRMEEQQRQREELEEKRNQEEQSRQDNQEQYQQEEQSRQQQEQQKNDNQDQPDPILVTPTPPREEERPKPPVVSIKHIDDLYRQVELGGSFSLPNMVQATLSNGTSKQLQINWVSTDIDTSRPGKYTLTGTVTGYTKLVRLHYYVHAGDEAFILLPKMSKRVGDTWIISSQREKIHFYLPESFTKYAGVQVHFLYDPNITVHQVLKPYSQSWITAYQEHIGITPAGQEKVELVYTILFDKNKELPNIQFKEELLFTLEVEGIYHDQTSGTIELKKVSGYHANGEVKEIKIKKPDPWHKKDYRVE